MSFYVKIRELRGRNDHYRLGEWLNCSGVLEVDYHQGGWDDKAIYKVHPHLKFEREDDAIAWVLAHGGEYSKKMPVNEPAEDSNSNQ